MNTSQSYVAFREDEQLHFGSHMSQFMHHTYDGSWPPVDPALCHYQFEHPKQQTLDYLSFSHPQPSYQASALPLHDNLSLQIQFSGWSQPFDNYRTLSYDSPNGQFGGSMSEASGETVASPEMTRLHIPFRTNRYLSPPAESQYSQQSWSTGSSFMITPTSTPASSHMSSSVALKELEFQGHNSEYQLDLQDDDIRSQLRNVPEELELSDSLATLTTVSRENTMSSNMSNGESDSARSSPAREDDSDSDFDPRYKSRQNLNQRSGVRSHRRTSSSSYPTLDVNNRIHKQTNSRSNANKEKSKPKALPLLNSTSNLSMNSKSPKSFPCSFHAFGCPSTFANKNEWKRHVTSQHLQLGFYRCDLGTCNPDHQVRIRSNHVPGLGQSSRGRGHSKRRLMAAVAQPSTPDPESEEVRTYNDFNRKDLFTQHCRRMHGPTRHLEDNTTQTNQAINARLRAQGRKIPSSGSGRVMSTKDDEANFEEELEAIRARCWKARRHAPSRSSCGFCGKVFEAAVHANSPDGADGRAEERAWEERMEHVGRHYDRDGCIPTAEAIDRDLLEWGLREDILAEVNGMGAGAWLVGYEIGRPETDDAEQRREGLRRRGPRRKVMTVVPLVIKTEKQCTPVMKEEDDVDSDIDALAEYE